MDELKPCPCCSSDDVVTSNTATGNYRASCADCRMSTAGWYSYAEALNAWNTRADGWISVGEHPKCSGRYTVNSSYGVRDAFFSEGFIAGDFRWQDCETGNDEGVENHHGIEFEVYNWMPLPVPPKAEK